MRVLMATNTYLPHVGGVARSVHTFAEEYRARGHEVLVVAPEFEEQPENESGVFRIPAIQNFNGSDFSVRLPIPALLSDALDEFAPQIVHSHHPFLMGDTALRIAASRQLPLVFTHHTMYERYTHYVPGNSSALKKYVKRLATGYANLCHAVIAPSESIAAVLRERGVEIPIHAIPTGIDVATFASGNGMRFRERYGIDADAKLIGHVGRLAPEKNLSFLARAVRSALRQKPDAHFAVIGEGPSQAEMRSIFGEQLMQRVTFAGTLEGQELVDGYAAMQLFAFASHTETQGMVLAEAMAAGVPIVAVAAPGASEIVHDGRNGRLLAHDNVREFAGSLVYILSLSNDEYEQVCRSAEETSEEFSRDLSVHASLELYESLLASAQPAISEERKISWDRARRLIEAEWDLLINRVGSFSFASWMQKTGRLLGMTSKMQSKDREAQDAQQERLDPVKRGYLCIQIDGLSYASFRCAQDAGRMPFLNRLLNRHGYELMRFYSGLPSATPAVQGELFYGKRGAVPAFSFRSVRQQKLVTMLQGSAVSEVESSLREQSRGLLEGGASLCNVYGGGARQVHFSPSSSSVSSAEEGTDNLKRMTIRERALTLCWMLYTATRCVALGVMEFFLGVYDAVRGVWQGRSVKQEVKFIFARVLITVLLREAVVRRARSAVLRGMPIVHLNFLGYDEQSHRRGPLSYFAQWSLRGIDDAVRRVWEAAYHAEGVHYQTVIYSDHGQVGVEPYEEVHDRTLRESVSEVLMAAAEHEDDYAGESERTRERARLLPVGRILRASVSRLRGGGENGIEIAAKGPVAHLYCGDRFALEEREAVALKLHDEAGVPGVLWCDEHGQVRAAASGTVLTMTECAAAFSGEYTVDATEIAGDLEHLVRHESAGEFVLVGWMPGSATALSFSVERGAHGGVHPQEVEGFFLLPSELRERGLRLEEGKGWVRAEKLYAHIANARFGVHANDTISRRSGAAPRDDKGKRTRVMNREMVRVASYNVHYCAGSDLTVDLIKTARAIQRLESDIVCVQELDVNHARSNYEHQPERLADLLEMNFHFHCTVDYVSSTQYGASGTQYGIAVFARGDIELVKEGRLMQSPYRVQSERRGALWVRVHSSSGRSINVVTTHLSLNRKERAIQVEELLGPRWVGGASDSQPLFLAGDFNFYPSTALHRMVSRELREVSPRMATWPARCPVVQLDYIFASSQVEVVRRPFVQARWIGKVSDHFPVVTECSVNHG